MEISVKYAEVIVNKLRDDIPYNINIMDKSAVIIASSDPGRVGQFHKGAFEVIETGKGVMIEEDTELEKEGTNEPIIYKDEIIGVVGLTGSINEVLPFTKIVSTVVSLLLEELNQQKKAEELKSEKANFIHVLLHEEENSFFRKTAFDKFNINIGEAYYILYSDDEAYLNKNYKYSTIFSYDNGYIVFVKSVKEYENTNALLIQSEYSSCYKEELVKISNLFNYLSFLSYPRSSFYKVKDYYLAVIFGFDLPIDKKCLSNVRTLSQMNKKVLLSYIKNGLNVNQTSLELYLHRNTVNYHLNQVEKITGEDVKDFSALFKLMYHLAYHEN